MQSADGTARLLDYNAVWRAEYRKRRYFRHASHADLVQRVKDMVLNMAGVGDSGKVGFVGGDADAAVWWCTFTELLEEFVLRFGPYPASLPEGFLKDAPLADPRIPLTKRAIAALKGVKIQPGTCLFKYGKEEHLRSGLEDGCFRISAASYYNDPSLNHAIRDDELSIATHRPADGFNVTVVKSRRVPAGTRIPMVGNLSITSRLSTNYFVWCFSRHLYAPLFHDFDEANACLVVRDPFRFLRDTFEAVESVLPEWNGWAEMVRYVDPYKPPRKELIDPFICKHFRFWSQQECRLFWFPDRPEQWAWIQGGQDKPAPLWVKLPNLREYADLVVV